MKKQNISSTVFYLIALPVLALAALGVWLAAAAVIENLRLASAADQVIAAVARSREMRISPKADAVRTQRELVDRLASFDGLTKVALPSGSGEYGFKTPWGKVVRVFVYPAAQAARFEVPLSRSSCRKMLQLYADDAGPLGLQRVDIRDQLPSALWRLVYEQPRNVATGVIEPTAIEAGCGNDKDTVVSLTFSLK